MQALIVADSFARAHDFAREELGLERGDYRLVTSAPVLRGTRGVEVHLVPGWEHRRDRFALKTALKYSRNTIIDHSQPADDDDDEVTSPNEEVTPPTTNNVIDLPVFEPEGDDTNTTDPGVPKRLRRKRCDDCGDLILPDEFDAHQEACRDQ